MEDRVLVKILVIGYSLPPVWNLDSRSNLDSPKFEQS